MNTSIPNDLRFGDSCNEDDCDSFKSALSTPLDVSNSFRSYSSTVPIESISFHKTEDMNESSIEKHDDSIDYESDESSHGIQLKCAPKVISSQKPMSYFHKESETVNSLAFNQDKDCIAFATSLGYQIQSLDYNTNEQKYLVHRVEIDGGILLVRMLHRTSLIAIVQTKTPRKLSLLHSKQGKVIKELPFTSAIRRMEMNKECLVVLTADAMLHVFVYRNGSIDFVKNINILNENESARMITAEGSATSCAFFDLSTHVVRGNSCLVTKSCQSIGLVSVYSISCKEDEPPQMNEILSFQAHNHSLSRIAIGLSDKIPIEGALIATCSLQGTIIRVFHLLTGQKLFELHRGSSSCTIYSLTFNQDNSSLVTYSSKGTVHIFSLSEGNKVDVDMSNRDTMVSNVLNRVLSKQKTDVQNVVKSYAKIRVKGEKPLLSSILSIHREHENETLSICMPSGKIFQYAVESRGTYKPVLATNLLLQKNTSSMSRK